MNGRFYSIEAIALNIFSLNIFSLNIFIASLGYF